MNFYETQMGRRFFDAQLPKLIQSLEQIAAALTKPAAPACTPPIKPNPDFLRDLYYGDYEPSVFQEDGRNTALNHAVSAAESVLRKELRANEAASAAFDTYQFAQAERDSAVIEQAFESGYQTAVQMLVAGLQSPGSSAFSAPQRGK